MLHFLPLKIQIQLYSKKFQALFPDGFCVDHNAFLRPDLAAIPALRHGGEILNLDHRIPDRFAQETGITTTIFVRRDDDFFRISTSIKNQTGERAVGSSLDRAHPAHAALVAGQAYTGLASVFSVQLMTQYLPIQDASGNVIGAIVVGMNITSRRYAGLNVKLALLVQGLIAATLVLQSLFYEWTSRHPDSFLSNIGGTLAFSVTCLVIVGAIAGRVASASIGKSLVKAKAAMDRISSGDLTALLHVGRRDEIGDLLHAINACSQGLARLVAEVRQGSNQITSVSQEIAAGNTDLSTRTESQVAWLAATASSTASLTETVKLNVEHTMAVDAHASDARRIAEVGGKSVARLVTTMNEIKSSSLRISDVISIVENIAAQTNLLALNAAIEAARAGAEGRGFAVVAAEVRGLAQRCGSAAQEVKGLVEKAVVNVSNGEMLVGETGSTMAEIIASINGVVAVTTEVNRASQHQRSGIEKVNDAVQKMDDMSQENAALLEQAATAAQHMYDQALKLSGAVSIFKIA
ncbi:methyl-accepting chemotaxis protein [Herbaspirillum lusitanum]|uniref:methyl-accepting chemotaxis protein n=1 Tax=Herbaspirillum lusitanum TaxID=213312 RepID=UPI0002EC658C|nr:methyl-accepting chemotaxis protein [Herbaspirillum lusitanum]